MPARLPAGPYRVIESPDVGSVPYYVIPFDEKGRCEGPRTRQHLLDQAHGYTDIFLFSHGWNNDWSAATARYDSFIRGVQSVRKKLGKLPASDYRPLLVGVFWPSQALAWFDSETGPDFAATGAGTVAVDQDRAVQDHLAILRDVAMGLPADDRAHFFELAEAEQLAPDDARTLAEMLASVTASDDEGVRDDAPDVDDLLTAAATLQARETDGDDGAVGTATDAGLSPGEPSAALGIGKILSALDPRNLVKPFTVWQMKDRAGAVGHYGVGPLLAGLLERSNARVHLLGHSYGCKVVMTAVCASKELPRRVESALLLQPAISQYAFSEQVPEGKGPGGFHRALDRVRLPIVATYSTGDRALRRLFHIAVRRSKDAGELQFAAGGDHPTPSRYAAMGGYGPQAANAAWVDIQKPGGSYPLAGSSRVLAVNGSSFITDHGDVSNTATWWLSLLLAGTAAGGA